MEGKFRGKSPLDYLLEQAAPWVELLHTFFLGREVDESVYLSASESKPDMFSFIISSIDWYFYSKSTAKKRARVCRKVENLTHQEVAHTAPTGLPSFNFAGKL